MDTDSHFRSLAGRHGPAFAYSQAPRSDPALAGSMWRFWRTLPLADPSRAVSLGEGNTPLLRSRLFPGLRLWWKDEGRNPTGSHKDRALSVAASCAVALGARMMAVVSAGSTGLSTAAYAARAGLPALCLMGRGAPVERVYPAQALGARLIELDADIDTLIAELGTWAGRQGVFVASTTRRSCPEQAEASKTIAYEIVESMNGAPDWLVMPVGGGGTIAGIWRGFQELLRTGEITRGPRLAAVVPAAYDALAVAFAHGIDDPAEFAALPYRDDVPTVLTKLSHAHPPDGLEALEAVRASGGTVISLPDPVALDAVARVGARDGLYLEPSSAVVAPAIAALLERGEIKPGASVVALACGHGFRETFVMTRERPAPPETARLGDLPALLERA